MRLLVKSQEAGQAIKFQLQGFPEEAAVVSALERFYRGQASASRNFEIENMFGEPIFNGLADSQGRIERLTSLDRRDKPVAPKPE